jgi:hypothetical protein
VDLSEIQAAYYMVAATGVLVAAIYYVYNMRIAQRNTSATLQNRQAQLFTNLHQFSMTREAIEARYKAFELNLKTAEDYQKLEQDKESQYALSMMSQFVEGIGVLVRENLVDIRLVAEFKSGLVLSYWERFGPMILDVRKKMNFPRFMVEAEYLARRVEEYGEAHPELGVLASLDIEKKA